MTDTPFTPQQLNQALFNALKSGDYAVMQEALESGATIAAARDRETNRNLLFAIIDRMADISHDHSEFPRLTAMFVNYMTQGLDPNARDNAGVSVLNHALQRENYLVPSMLVAAGVNVNENFPQKNGDTPLHIAVELAIAGKGGRLLDTMLNANADPTAANDNGVSAFDIVRNADTEHAPHVMAKISAAPQLQVIFAAERQANQEKLRAQAKRFKLGGP